MAKRRTDLGKSGKHGQKREELKEKLEKQFDGKNVDIEIHPKRPLGLVLTSILFFAVAALFAAIAVMIIMPESFLGIFVAIFPPFGVKSIDVINTGTLLAVPMLSLALFLILLGWGLFDSHEWARMSIVMVGVLCFPIWIILGAFGGAANLILMALGIILSIFLIWYLQKDSVKKQIDLKQEWLETVKNVTSKQYFKHFLNRRGIDVFITFFAVIIIVGASAQIMSFPDENLRKELTGDVDVIDDTPDIIANPSGNRYAEVETTMGTITFELFENNAPISTANFIHYAEDGYYDGLIFHRVIDDFVVQGGGFLQDGNLKGQTYPPIELEIVPGLLHEDGCVAMARTNDPNSATSQFYFCDGPQSSLNDKAVDPAGRDGGYAVFGKIADESSMAVMRLISGVSTDSGDKPIDNVMINHVSIVG